MPPRMHHIPRAINARLPSGPRIPTRTLASRSSQSSSASSNSAPPSSEEESVARDWLAALTPRTLDRNLGELSFSRSSGPGGQNVNKVNSKATLRIPISRLRPIVPGLILREMIATSSLYARGSDALLLQADSSRRQSDNVEACWVKLAQAMSDAAAGVLRGETSPEQAARVKELQKKEAQARMRMKKAQSSKKSARRSKGDE